MDTVYPEPMSRLHRRAIRKQTNRASSGRYRTQPITFQEIKEVDEENLEDHANGDCEPTAGTASKSELDLNLKFEEFWRLGREKAKEKKKKRETKEKDVLITDDVTPCADNTRTPSPTEVTNDSLHTLVTLPARSNANPRTSI